MGERRLAQGESEAIEWPQSPEGMSMLLLPTAWRLLPFFGPCCCDGYFYGTGLRRGWREGGRGGGSRKYDQPRGATSQTFTPVAGDSDTKIVCPPLSVLAVTPLQAARARRGALPHSPLSGGFPMCQLTRMVLHTRQVETKYDPASDVEYACA